jgi:hypothetical protein
MSDKIIRFPGLSGNPNPEDPRQPDPPQLRPAKPPPALPQLPASDIEKALGIIHAVASKQGLTAFVLVGVKPAQTGADFFTVVHGDASDLRNAQDHLGDVIARAYTRKGI